MIREMLKVSVVIPTYNRKNRVISLLENLSQVSYSFLEVIIVDSGHDIKEKDFKQFDELNIIYHKSVKSLCAQRNIGIHHAKGDWIFLCDDDMEIPKEYITNLHDHIISYSHVGAVSGLVLQKDENNWVEQYPVRSMLGLLWRFIFQLGIWGEIKISSRDFITRFLISYYKTKGNHVSNAGWPVITDFSGDYFTVPVFGLGASLIRKDWLLNSLYDENLETNGIGDNYGVSLGFPGEIHVVQNAYVYHHTENINRLNEFESYFNRCLALHYFLSTKNRFKFSNKIWFYWSVLGNALYFIFKMNRKSVTSFKVLLITMAGFNPLVRRNSKK